MLKATVFAVALIVVTFTAAGSASAQSFRGGYFSPAPTFYPSCMSSRASTYGGSYYGSPGDTINRAEARRREIENRKKYVQTYFEIKEINRLARAEARGPRPTAEDLARYAKEQVPDRLAAQQIDAQRGVIRWPRVFDEQEFAAARSAVEDLAREDLVGHGSIGSSYGEAKRRLAQMAAELKNKMNALPSGEYIAAKKFLIGLDLEFRSPQVSTALAAK